MNKYKKLMLLAISGLFCLVLCACGGSRATTYSLTVSASTGGTVSAADGKYAAGTSVSLTATSGINYNFDGWYEGDTKLSSENPYSYNMPAKNTTIKAIFSAKAEQSRCFVVVPPENVNDNFDEEGYDKLVFGKIQADGALIKPMGSALPKKTGYQAEDLYLNKECTVKVPFDKNSSYYPAPEFIMGTGRYKVFPIYTKWISNKFIRVETASAIRTITATGNYYIMRDLDFTGITLSVPEIYSGEIAGNNYIWNNLKVTVVEIDRITQGFYAYGGIFKNLTGAVIKDITFKNLNITFVRRSPKAGDIQTWESEARFNIFAKSIDELSVVQNIKLGTSESGEYSSFKIVNTTEFNRLQIIDKDEYGNPFRVSFTGVSYVRVAVKQDGQGDPIYDNGNPVYPEEGELVDGIEIHYAKNRLGEYELYKISAVDDEDGRELWGNETLPLPSFAPSLSIGQNEDNFGFASGNISGCKFYMTQEIVPTPWKIKFKNGDEQPEPLAASDYTTEKDLECAGWYAWNEAENRFEKFDFTAAITEPVILTAMWKQIVG